MTDIYGELGQAPAYRQGLRARAERPVARRHARDARALSGGRAPPAPSRQQNAGGKRWPERLSPSGSTSAPAVPRASFWRRTAPCSRAPTAPTRCSPPAPAGPSRSRRPGGPRHGRGAAGACSSVAPATTSPAIGLSGQMHGSVFLDRQGAPIRPALLVERRPDPCRMRRDRAPDRARARDRDHRQSRQHRHAGTQAAVAAQPRARRRRPGRQAAAAQGLHPPAAHRRARDRRRGRVGHAVPRPRPPRLQRRGPDRAGGAGRPAAAGVRGPRGHRPGDRRRLPPRPACRPARPWSPAAATMPAPRSAPA